MVKKSSKVSKKPNTDQHVRHRIILGASIVIIAVLLGLVLSLVIIPRVTNDIRLNRINEIYASIQLPQNTYFNKADVFGDKRPYEYDADRTSSSSKTFVVAKTVTETMAIVDKSVQDAGYTLFDEMNPGSTSQQRYYKSDRGEYIRLTVSSKLRDDAASNELLMTGKFSDAFLKIDPNAGPSTVTLRVNLDDNNE